MNGQEHKNPEVKQEEASFHAAVQGETPAKEGASSTKANHEEQGSEMEQKNREERGSAPAEMEIVGKVEYAQAETPRSHRRRSTITQLASVKTIAFLLFVVMTLTAVVSGFAAVVMVKLDLYTTPEEEFRNRYLQVLVRSMVEDDAYRIAYTLIQDGIGSALSDAYENSCLDGVRVICSGLNRNVWTMGSVNNPEEPETVIFQWYWYRNDLWTEDAFGDIFPEESQDAAVDVQVTASLSEALTVYGSYDLADRLITAAYRLRYWIYAVGASAVLMMVLCFVFLMNAAGHHRRQEGVTPGWGTRIPFDLLTAAVGLAVFLGIEFAVEAVYYFDDWLYMVILLLVIAGFSAALLGWSMSLAVRMKLGKWWENTLVFRILRPAARCLYRVLRFFGLSLRRFVRTLRRGVSCWGEGVRILLRGIPLVWKTALILLGITVVDGFFVIYNTYYGFRVCSWDILWIFLRMFLLAALLFGALMLKKLQRGGEKLAEGDLSHQVDTKFMYWDFKQHGENLNRIGEGMTAAVDQRMKSERMKTELITNVSHDIKTPLTSIINYADLISKEPCGNENVKQYAEVLCRQSERLKRLIEDLVEASKASTGNLEIFLAPCEAGVLLTQAAGEYEQRLKDGRLEFVTSQPEHPVKIMADGRRLWRVIDNLMNNICKYAQSGTRVYLTLEERDGKAVFSFKNTSREALNIPAEDLLERFVQGDSARSGGGNGLGLSIARSLTELQNGTLSLTVDGDLFKVVLAFPLLK